MTNNPPHSPLLLVILDGWGLAPSWGGNAISVAKTPTMDQLWRTMPHTQLQASSEAVGLPPGIMGNSEVGHLNIGAGKIVKQFLPLIDEQIRNGQFYQNPVLVSAMIRAKNANATLHLVGIMSDGSVHGHLNHLLALLQMAKTIEVPNIAIHAITDGRDTEPTEALVYLDKLLTYLKTSGSSAKLATICGRFYAMDRDNRWERTAKAYQAFVYGEGEAFSDPRQAITSAYAKGTYDEFIEPVVITDSAGNKTVMKDGDIVICYNFRSDRMRQITEALCKSGAKMDLGANAPTVSVITFTEYQSGLPVEVAFQPDTVPESLSDVIAKYELTQFHVAETEKYAHVTYFFNGGNEAPEPLETRLLIPSPKVSTYDQAPKMSAEPIADAVVDKLRGGQVNFYVINFANADMVGHTGNIQATVTAVETIDQCLSRIWAQVQQTSGTLIITADHGKAEEMIDPATGLPDTEHTGNPVPFIVASRDPTINALKLKPGGYLGNVAPTILDILNLQKPETMTLDSLVDKT